MNVPRPSDPVELWMNRALQISVALSAALIGLGTALWIVTGDAGFGPDAYPLTLGPILAGALDARPVAMIQAGLLLLIVTPVFRVGTAAWLFIRQGDRTYTLITLAVFAVLMALFLKGGV